MTDVARGWLALTGYDPAYGARPLRRLVQSATGDEVVVDADPTADRLTVKPAVRAA